MRSDLPYSEWKKELDIWCRFTDMDADRQGGALFLTLSGKPRECVLAEVSGEKIASAKGVAEITAALDKLFLKDASQSAFAAFGDFIKYRRPTGTPISDFLIEFNLKYNKIKSYNMALPEGVLAYCLLTCANLPEDQDQICRATVNTLTYEEMRGQIEKIVVTSRSQQRNDFHPEPQFFTGVPETGPSGRHAYHAEPRGDADDDYDPDACDTDTAYYTYQGRRYPPSSAPRNVDYHSRSGAQLNPRDQFGNPLPCRFCHSVYHMIDGCPHAPRSAKFSRGRGYYRPGRGRQDGGRGSRGGARDREPAL